MIAAVFWISDSIIHWFVYRELQFEMFPSDFNEFWMRTLIILLIIGFGIYVEYNTKKRIILLEERKKAYKDVANEAKKILKDFLHDVQYFESEAERIGGFDGNTMKNLEGFLKNTQGKLSILDSTGDLTADNEIIHE